MKENEKIPWTRENTMHFTDTLYAIEPSQRRQALMDLFAIGCYLRLAGKHNAGTKACLTALDGMQLRDEEAKAIWQGLNDGKENFLAKLFRPHSEIMELFSEVD